MIPADRAILALPIASIAIPAQRIGFFDASHAKALGADMALCGQHDPIHVKRNGSRAKLPWTLIAGLHRLRGAESAGLMSIDAIQVAGAGASAAELLRLELSENLDHRQRRPIERAIFVAARARIEEEADHPGRVGERSQDRAVRVRQSTAVTLTDVDWRQRTATAMGCSLSTVERLQRIHRDIVEALPDLAEPLNFHPLGESLKTMRYLAGMPLSKRRAAANAVIAAPEATCLKSVLVAAGIEESNGNRVDPNQPDAAFMAAFGKMKGVRRRVTLFALADELTPTDVLGMVEVFKRRGIIGDNHRIA